MKDAPDELAPAIKRAKVVTKNLGEGEVEFSAEIKAWGWGPTRRPSSVGWRLRTCVAWPNWRARDAIFERAQGPAGMRPAAGQDDGPG